MGLGWVHRPRRPWRSPAGLKGDRQGQWVPEAEVALAVGVHPFFNESQTRRMLLEVGAPWAGEGRPCTGACRTGGMNTASQVGRDPAPDLLMVRLGQVLSLTV